jgi:hypothetical protein
MSCGWRQSPPGMKRSMSATWPFASSVIVAIQSRDQSAKKTLSS